MSALIFKQKAAPGWVELSFSCEENGFSPSNLLVRKIFYFMLRAVEDRADRFEVEYIDRKLVEEMGMDAAAKELRLLGASREKLRDNKQGGVVVSRIFTSELNEERLNYFYRLVFLDRFLMLRFLEGDELLLSCSSGKILSLRAPENAVEQVLHQLKQDRIPYTIEDEG